MCRSPHVEMMSKSVAYGYTVVCAHVHVCVCVCVCVCVFTGILSGRGHQPRHHLKLAPRLLAPQVRVSVGTMNIVFLVYCDSLVLRRKIFESMLDMCVVELQHLSVLTSHVLSLFLMFV
jgi:hypothetical protein